MGALVCALLLAGSLSAAKFGLTVHQLGCWNDLHQTMDLLFAENQPGSERRAKVEPPRCLGVGS
jgi:hypothetical protein